MGVEWHPKLSHFEENLHPNLSHPNRLPCLIFEQGWANCDARSRFFKSNVSEHSYFGVSSRTKPKTNEVHEIAACTQNSCFGYLSCSQVSTKK
jgi:hypothetical protein